ncbi:hypothetical protein Tdes44962_MAKER06645 [Teratosphaeria destructans]|uniref:Uncharacterized protein n=1 Tax=Teratosphaeria destructans TaxID=418781 RepID=A0A9W7T1J6_9PEZI|nr:hypothetical protein Tdes44962_MAKER06645 [Teratosphaeria destructans]
MAELHGYDTHHEMGLDGERVQLPANKEEGGPWSIVRRAELEDSRALGELEGSEGLKHEHEGVELSAHGE